MMDQLVIVHDSFRMDGIPITAMTTLATRILSSGEPSFCARNETIMIADVTPLSTANDAALDVLSADVGIGSSTLAFVVRVADLAEEISPQTHQWMMWFDVRGQSFATSATRATDGVSFRVVGDFPEHESAAPGVTSNTIPVTGSFDLVSNEIRVDVPRRHLPVIRPSLDALTNLTVDSLTGVGITTERVSATTTVDRTSQPGPRLTLSSQTCVRAR